MNFQRNYQNVSELKHSKTKSQVETASGSSDYSTCSDNPAINIYGRKQNSRESSILAGQIMSIVETGIEPHSDTILEDTNIYISPHDLNVNITSSDNDVFTDCTDYSIKSHDESTQYLEIAPVVISKDNEPSSRQTGFQDASPTESRNSSSSKEQVLQDRLLTIIEEKEITNTTNHTVNDLLPLNADNDTGKLLVKLVDQIETLKEQNNNFSRNVLLVNLGNVKDTTNNKLQLKKTKKRADSYAQCPVKAMDACNHNTTESFVLWEQFCENSEKLASRRSFSFSELNSNAETCTDSSNSTSYQTLDDIHLPESSTEILNHAKSHKCKGIRRSRSCESILQEVKHLPHLMYDRFLKSLSREIERIRKENVVCTCKKLHEKNYNKENEKKRSPKKPTLKLTNKIPIIQRDNTESRLPLQVPNYSKPTKNRLSPKITKNSHLSPTTSKMRFPSETANRKKISPVVASRRILSPELATTTHSQLQQSPKSLTRLQVLNYTGATNKRLSPKPMYHIRSPSPVTTGLKFSSEAENKTRLSPEPANQRKLSPDPSKTLSPRFQNSSKSPRTPTTPSKSYFWNKEIVSVVGEYIRGKRQINFPSSPNKK